jgi:CHAD domain-containing protein
MVSNDSDLNQFRQVSNAPHGKGKTPMSEHLYDVGPDFVFPDLTEVDGATSTGPETQQLTTVYYDTPDARLAQRGVTLRRRQGGTEPGWQLSLAAANGAKEVRAPLGKAGAPVPARLARLVSGHTRGRDLVPVAELEMARTVYRMRRPSGQELARVADDVITGHRVEPPGTTSTARSWRQLEVELATGSRTLARSVEGCLRSAGARASTGNLGFLSAGGAAERRTPKTAGEVFAGYLRHQVDAALAYDPLVRLGGRDEGAVPKLLAAVRGVRGVLRTHHRILDPGRIAAPEAELKWLDGELSRVRDLEVLGVRLAAVVEVVPEAAEQPGWLSGLDQRAAAERRRLDKAMSSPRYFALLDILDRYVIDPPFGDGADRKARKETPRLLARAWRKVLAAYADADALPPGGAQDKAWHRTWQAASRAGHLAEAAAPALGRPAKKIAKHAVRVQDGLGDRADAILLQEHLGQVRQAEAASTSDVYLAGLVAGIEHGHADRSLRAVRHRWRKAANPKHLRTLDG